jgi:hypothetical protein
MDFWQDTLNSKPSKNLEDRRMEIKISTKDISWWFWALTLVSIIVALIGWVPGYYLVIIISVIQVIFFFSREKSLMAFPVQIRIVYFASTLFGLWPAVRFPFFILLFLGTIMVTFFGKCSIALILKHMPWNSNRELRLN